MNVAVGFDIRLAAVGRLLRHLEFALFLRLQAEVFPVQANRLRDVEVIGENQDGECVTVKQTPGIFDEPTGSSPSPP